MFEEHSFMFGELDGETGKLAKSDYINIAKAGTNLAHCVYTIIEGKKVTNIPVFDHITTEDGIVTAQFNDYLKNYLLQLREGGMWTSLNYLEYRKLSSIYAQHIYLLLRSWENTNDKEKWEYHFSVTLEELHQKCGTAEKYPRYINFRQKVLEPAQRELHKKLGYDFWFIPIKEGKKVARILFFYKWESYKKIMELQYPKKIIQSENLD